MLGHFLHAEFMALAWKPSKRSSRQNNRVQAGSVQQYFFIKMGLDYGSPCAQLYNEKKTRDICATSMTVQREKQQHIFVFIQETGNEGGGARPLLSIK